MLIKTVKLIVIICIMFILSFIIIVSFSVSLVSEYSVVHRNITLQNLEETERVKLLKTALNHLIIIAILHILIGAFSLWMILRGVLGARYHISQ